MYHLDFETRSHADLKKVGAFRYANDPSTEILCVASSKDDEEPVIWTCTGPVEYGNAEQGKALKLIREISSNPEALVYAHNASFEIAISDALWQKTFGCPPPRHDQWRCTMAMARRAALPASLDKCSQALGLTQKKDARGSSLIRKFCVPAKSGDFLNPEDDPDAFKDLCDYCVQDVRVEKAIHKKLHAFELKGLHLSVFQLTLDINTRGIPVNLDALQKAQKIIDAETERLTTEFQRITGLLPTQTAKVLAWLKSVGYEGDNLRAETLEEALDDEEFDAFTPYGAALSLKKQISYASLKKVAAMIACAGPHDNRVRGTLNDYGAGTGRWSASLIQPQNFKKPSKHLEKLTEGIYRDIIAGADAAYLSLVYGPPLECISSCIRHFIHDYQQCDFCGGAPYPSSGLPCPECDGIGGREAPFLDADYSAIEARIIAWQAQEEWRLEVFRTHGKIYEASAAQVFDITLEELAEYKEANGHHHPLRKKGQLLELALGYGGGKGALDKMGAAKAGLLKEEFKPLIDAWRERSPGIVNLWREGENAAKQAVKNPGARYPFGVGCEMFTASTAGMERLFMRLPSGRRISYPQPKLEKQLRWTTVNKVTGEEVAHGILNPTVEEVQKAKAKDPKARISDALTYWGQIPMKAVWGRISLYGGKIAENLCQAIAADVMAIGADNAKQAGYEICMLVHDQAIAHLKPGQNIDDFIRHLTNMPEWANGLPLSAAGGIVPFYRKD